MSKGNERLKQELKSLVVSSEKADIDEKISRQIPAIAKNIQTKLAEVAEWFNDD